MQNIKDGKLEYVFEVRIPANEMVIYIYIYYFCLIHLLDSTLKVYITNVELIQ